MIDSREYKRLKEQYAGLSDGELKELLSQDKSGFEPEAFDLLAREAHKRLLDSERESVASTHEEPAAVDEPGVADGQVFREDALTRAKELLGVSAPQVKFEQPVEEESYVQLIVANHPDDVEAIQTILSSAEIDFYFQPVSYAGKDLPVALFVQQQRADESVELLRNFQPKSSIVLW
jgi:hypothetical protein